jgi:Trypsin
MRHEKSWRQNMAYHRHQLHSLLLLAAITFVPLAVHGHVAVQGRSTERRSLLGFSNGRTAAVSGSLFGSRYSAASFSGLTAPSVPQPSPPPPCATPSSFRIVGGTIAPKDRYKWACSMRGNNDFHFCGCTLIAPSVALTAAHCVDHDDEALSSPWVEVWLGLMIT